MASLATLPTEVLEYVTQYLPYNALTKLRLTCRRNCAIVDPQLFQVLTINVLGRQYMAPKNEPFLASGNCQLYCESPSFICEHGCYKGQVAVRDAEAVRRVGSSASLVHVKRIVVAVQFEMDEKERIEAYKQVEWLMKEVIPQKCPRVQLVDVYAPLSGFQPDDLHHNVLSLIQPVVDTYTDVDLNFNVAFSTPGELSIDPPLANLLDMNLKIFSLTVFPFEVSFVIAFLLKNHLPQSVQRFDVTQLECPGAEEALAHFVSKTTKLESFHFVDSLTIIRSTEWIPECIENLLIWDHSVSAPAPTAVEINEQPKLLPNLKSATIQTEYGSIVSRLIMPKLERFSICQANPWDRDELRIDWPRLFAQSTGIRQLVCNNMTFSTVASIAKHLPNLDSLVVQLSLYHYTNQECFDHLCVLADECGRLENLRVLMLELRYVAAEHLMPVLKLFKQKCSPHLQNMYIDVGAFEDTMKVLEFVDARFIVDGISRLPVNDSDWHRVLINRV